MIRDFIDEYERYRILGDKAIRQVPDEALNQSVYADGNSVAVIVRHISGNLISRFTDFLTSDGEKPWRDRETEFAEVQYDRQQVEEMWARGWQVLQSELGALSDDDLNRSVAIRGQSLTVHQALCRSLAHTAMHVGQIILLARLLHQGEWQWLSIPKGQSAQYNLNPTMEKRPQ
ncbi:MAG: DUF1572 family protein [Blastocatellia bacterium]